MHRLINIFYSGFIVGVGLGTVFQLCFLPLLGMRAHDEWTGLLWWGFAISLGDRRAVGGELLVDERSDGAAGQVGTRDYR